LRHEGPRVCEAVRAERALRFTELSEWSVHTAVPGQRPGIQVPALQGQPVLLFWENDSQTLTES